MQVPSMEYGARFLSIGQSKIDLEALSIGVFGVGLKCEWASLLPVVAQSCVAQTLRVITLEDSSFGALEQVSQDGAEWPYSLNFDALHPLFTFSILTHLTLGCRQGFLLNDLQMRELAMAWPLMEKLVLGTTHHEADHEPPERPHTATIQSLVSLARYCPRLRYLAFDFDATSVVYDEDSMRDVRQFSLTDLTVELSPIKKARVVTALLSAMFPNLRLVCSGSAWGEDGPNAGVDVDAELRRQSKWMQVTRLVRMLWNHRAQTRGQQGDSGQSLTVESALNSLEEYDTDDSDM